MRVTGLYDQRTIQLLKENKIYSLGFDLRPKSLNFIQSYRLIELLKEVQLGEVYLHFENEKDFIGIDFNIKSNETEFKIILFFTKLNVKFIPLFFINKNFNVELINNSQFYKSLKENFNKKNNDFFEMFNYSEYLHQNSLYLFNIS